MNNTGCIYFIECLESCKGYVGQYVKPNPKGRWTSHLRSAKKGCKYLLHHNVLPALFHLAL